MTHYHAAVWIDHHEAHIVSFNPDEASSETVQHTEAVKHHRHVAGSEILIVGPANAKFALLKHLQAKHPKLAEKVVGIETVDHPSDGQLANYARAYFHKKDRMLPQIG